jgi:hypothetical protein
MEFFKKAQSKKLLDETIEDNIFDIELKSLKKQLGEARESLEISVEDAIIKESVIKLYPSYAESKSNIVLSAINNLTLAKKRLVEALEAYEIARKNYNGFLTLNRSLLSTTGDYVGSSREGHEVVENTYKDFYRKLAKY